MKRYAIQMGSNGSFSAEDVAPGSYSLDITVHAGVQFWNRPPLAQGSIQVTVPDSFDPTTPIDIGEVLLKPVSSHP